MRLLIIEDDRDAADYLVKAFREVGHVADLANDGEVNPSVDAIGEFKLITNNYSAEYAHAMGGITSFTMKSGTNQFHGTGYYIHRDAKLNANLYENIVRGIPKQEVFHYNPGGTFGGPVKRDKTFFFYSYEGLKSGIPVGAVRA